MSLVPATVVRRFLAKKAGFGILSDDRFRPPASIANAVAEGKMPEEVLNVWKYVATKHSDHFEYNACVVHWRNKCAKMGIALPPEYIEGLGGKGSQGAFAAKTGEQVEDWVKETLKSKGLLAEVGNSVHDWLMEINSFERKVAEAQEDIDKHMKGLAEGDRVKQRQKWLEGAQKKFDAAQKELDACKAALKDLQDQMARYDSHKAPTVAFEAEFQLMMQLAAKDFDKKSVLEAVQKAIQRFEQGLDLPEMSDKTAGLTDIIPAFLSKAWDFLKSAWAEFTNWVGELVGTTKKLDKLLSAAGAD